MSARVERLSAVNNSSSSVFRVSKSQRLQWSYFTGAAELAVLETPRETPVAMLSAHELVGTVICGGTTAVSVSERALKKEGRVQSVPDDRRMNTKRGLHRDRDRVVW